MIAPYWLSFLQITRMAEGHYFESCVRIWGLYSPQSDPDPEMIPNPEMIPKLTPKWYRPRNDPHFSSRRPRNDPQLILRTELVFRNGIITNPLQRLRS